MFLKCVYINENTKLKWYLIMNSFRMFTFENISYYIVIACEYFILWGLNCACPFKKKRKICFCFPSCLLSGKADSARPGLTELVQTLAHSVLLYRMSINVSDECIYFSDPDHFCYRIPSVCDMRCSQGPYFILKCFFF